MKQKKLIALCGMSATGKSTLIKKLLSADKKGPLRQRFGIAPGETVLAFGADFGSPTPAHDQADVLLLKWQWDYNDKINYYCQHGYDCHAFVLWAPWLELWDSWSRKCPDKNQVTKHENEKKEYMRRTWTNWVEPRLRRPFTNGHELDPRVRIEVVDRRSELYEPVPGGWETITAEDGQRKTYLLTK